MITTTHAFLGGKKFLLKANVDLALADTGVKTVLVATETEDSPEPVTWNDRDIKLEEVQ